MASLTQTAIITRKIIRYSIYTLVSIIIIRYTLIIGTRAYKHFFPEPPPPPTVSYGTLPKLAFPERPSYKDLIFTLETPDGGLPEFPTQVNTYFMPRRTSNIQSVARAKQKASSLGFNPNGREITDTTYIFENQSANSTLNMNIVTNVFSISHDLSSSPNIIRGNPPAPQTAIAQAKSYLARAGLLADDISGPAEYELIKIREGKFVRAISLSEADVIKVNLFRKSFDEYPSLSPDPKLANIWFMIGGKTKRSSSILAGEYHYFPLDITQSATYPLKTSQMAWEDLKSGKGFLAKLGKNKESGEIKIRRVYLAYYDPGIYVEFYQPIAVFEGDNEFSAYVPAIIDEYYGIEQTNEE